LQDRPQTLALSGSATVDVSSLARESVRDGPRTVSGENVSTIAPHTPRRTFGSYLLNNGLRLEVVSRL
jgi:site-specific recombinase XerD